MMENEEHKLGTISIYNTIKKKKYDGNTTYQNRCVKQMPLKAYIRLY